MLGVSDRDVESDQHRVAEKLIHDTAIAVDRFDNGGEILAEHLNEPFGRHALDDAGEALDVGIEDGRDSLGRSQGTAAGYDRFGDADVFAENLPQPGVGSSSSRVRSCTLISSASA
jgi:hypothetical protein